MRLALPTALVAAFAAFGCAPTPEKLTEDVNFNSQAVYDHTCEICPSILGSATTEECWAANANRNYLPVYSPCIADAYALDEQGSLATMQCFSDAFWEMHECVETTLVCNDGGASYAACDTAHQAALASCEPFPTAVFDAMTACAGL